MGEKTESLKVKLATVRIPIAPYDRINDEGHIEHVDFHWREIEVGTQAPKKASHTDLTDDEVYTWMMNLPAGPEGFDYLQPSVDDLHDPKANKQSFGHVLSDEERRAEIVAIGRKHITATLKLMSKRNNYGRMEEDGAFRQQQKRDFIQSIRNVGGPTLPDSGTNAPFYKQWRDGHVRIEVEGYGSPVFEAIATYRANARYHAHVGNDNTACGLKDIKWPTIQMLEFDEPNLCPKCKKILDDAFARGEVDGNYPDDTLPDISTNAPVSSSDFKPSRRYVIRLKESWVPASGNSFPANSEFFVIYGGATKGGKLKFQRMYAKYDRSMSINPDLIDEVREIPLGNYADTALVSRLVGSVNGLIAEQSHGTRIRGYKTYSGNYKVTDWGGNRWDIDFREPLQPQRIAEAVGALEDFGFVVEQDPKHVSRLSVSVPEEVPIPDIGTNAPITATFDPSIEDMFKTQMRGAERGNFGDASALSGLSLDEEGNIRIINATTVFMPTIGGSEHSWSPLIGLKNKEGNWTWYRENEKGDMVPLYNPDGSSILGVPEDVFNTEVRGLVEAMQKNALSNKSPKNHGEYHTKYTFIAHSQVRAVRFKAEHHKNNQAPTFPPGSKFKAVDGKTYVAKESSASGVWETVQGVDETGATKTFWVTEVFMPSEAQQVHIVALDMGMGYHNESRFIPGWYTDDGHFGVLFNLPGQKMRRTPEKALEDGKTHIPDGKIDPVKNVPFMQPIGLSVNVPPGVQEAAKLLQYQKLDDETFAQIPDGKGVAFWALKNFYIDWSDFLQGINWKTHSPEDLSDKQARAVLNSLRKSFVKQVLGVEPNYDTPPAPTPIPATPKKSLDPLEPDVLPDLGTMAEKRKTGAERTLEVIARYFPPKVKPGYRRVYVLTSQLPSDFKDGVPKGREVVSRLGKSTLSSSASISRYSIPDEVLAKLKKMKKPSSPMNVMTDDQILIPLRAIEIEVPIDDVVEGKDGTLTLKSAVGADAITRIFDKHPRTFYSLRENRLYDPSDPNEAPVEIEVIQMYMTHNPYFYDHNAYDKRAAYDKWIDAVEWEALADKQFPYMYQYGVKDGKAPSGSYMYDVYTNLASVTQPFYPEPMEVTGTSIEVHPKGTPSKAQVIKDLSELPHVKKAFEKDGAFIAVLDYDSVEWDEYGAGGRSLWESPSMRWTMPIATYVREHFPGVQPEVFFGNGDFGIKDENTLYVAFDSATKKDIVGADVEVTALRKEIEMPNGETRVIGPPDIALEEIRLVLASEGRNKQKELQQAYEIAKQATEFYMREDVRVRTRIPEIGFREALKQGRFKSQFEVGTSNAGGVYLPDHRAEAEYLLHGIPLDADASHHPISGFLTDKEPSWGDSYDMFGNVEVVFKNDIKNRVTIVGGGADSLSAGGASGKHLGATLGSRVTWIDSVEPWAVDMAGPPVPGLVEREVQVQGGLYASEIAYVIFPREPEEATLKLLKKYGIEYVIMQPKNTAAYKVSPDVADWYTPGMYMDYDGRKAIYADGRRETSATSRVY